MKREKTTTSEIRPVVLYSSLLMLIFAGNIYTHVGTRISIMPDLLRKESSRGRLAFFDSCVFAYSCSHPSLSGCALTSMFCIYPNTTQHVNAPCAKTNWSTLYKKKLAPGRVILELKACLFVQPRFQERGGECGCVARRGEQ